MKMLFLIGLLVAAGCGSEADCVSICEEAQDRDCTSIDDCDRFCSRSTTVARNADCQSERNALESCAEDGDACTVDARCNDEENAFGACIAPYCLANPSATECDLD